MHAGLQILLAALVAIAVVHFAGEPWKGRLLNVLKAWVTVLLFWVLLSHHVTTEDGSQVVAWELILDQLARIEAGTFWGWVAAATAIKIVGILASMRRWVVMLKGQGIELPFRHIFGSFLIGRFIGTFLPSTAGLDGYLLYDASRFSGRTVEVAAAKFLEKIIGLTGIFLSYLVALPAGIAMFYSILGRDNGLLVAGAGVALSAGVLGGLLAVLWFPGMVQWLIEHLPLPGKARLAGLVSRVSRAAAAYRHKKGLVVQALALSFVVHFTTAAMYYFTARAIGAAGAEFWPIVLASSIQILATVLSPFTIAGEGIRELAQLVLLQNMIGPAAAIVSAALGFWAAEAPTLLGGFFWWARGRDYRPEYCRVRGEQVDWEEAARNAVALETEEERAAREAAPTAPLPSFAARLVSSAGLGFGTGVVSGVLIGGVEAVVIAAGGFGGEAQVLWYGPLAYAVVLGALGTLGGALLAVLPMDLREMRGWTPSLGLLGLLVPFGLVITLFRVRRDVFAEQMPPLPVLLAILGGFGALALVLFFLGPRLFRSRAGLVFTPPVALALLALACGGGAVAARVAAGGPSAPEAPAPVPAALAGRPNVILIMVDTLRADQLSCYGGPVETPHLCALAEQGGTLFDGFAHATWTKPSTASLLSSLVPSTHKTMSKPAVLGEDAVLASEAFGEAGYATGAVVSNINLTPSFGFAQGFDEFHYLGPDYLAGAKESSSRLILYQIARKVWFRVKPGLRFGDFYQDSQVVNEVALDWLERHRDARFFLFLHYMDPHDPYFAHPYDGTGIARVAQEHPDPARADEMLRLYRGEIAYLDRNVGRLFERLRELGLWDESLIALTSDHGEEFHEHGGWWHGLTVYEEQIHVPLLVKWPAGGRGAPARAAGLGRHIDVAPTLAAVAGVAPHPSWQGVDLRAAWEERPDKDRMHLVEEDHEGNVLRALRTDTWKWIEANEGNPRGLPPRELFHVERDPGETENLVEERADVAARLAEDARTAVELAEAGGLEGAEHAVTKAECERLAILGYMNAQDCEKLN